ncbi:MAG: hypothetical protein H0T11_06455, partial [Chthoniobacterales bacterium]|nr:hypothetical protein [Chthoniobacterales bacterium]
MPELDVTHTWLPMLLATQKIELKALELKGAKLVVRQDKETGRWNLQEVAELLARTGGKQQAQEQTASKRALALPKIIVEKATVIVVDRAGKTATLEPVGFTGLPDASAPTLVYKYELASGSILNASGQLLPGGSWKHEVKFDLKDAGKLLEPWLGALEPLLGALNPVAAKGQWQGESADGGVKGRLTLERASVFNYGASGTVVAQVGPGTSVELKPQELIITTTQKLLPEAKIISGVIRFDGDTLNADAINLQAMGGVAEATASYTLASNVADVTANWYNLGPVDAGIRQSGSFKAALRNPFPGNPDVQASLTSRGEIDNIGRWDTEMTLNGGGKQWKETDWKVAVSKLKWDGKIRPVDIKQLTADFQVRDQTIRLTRMHLAEGGEVSGTGSVDLASAEKKWTLKLNGNGWPLPRIKESVFEFKASADGTLKPHYFDIEQLYARSGDAEISARGTYDAQRPKPVYLDVKFSHRPEVQIADEQDILRGRLIGEGRIEGTLASTPEQRSRIDLAFKLHGQELAFKERKLGDMDIEITGEADSEQATIRSQELDLLGGRWSLGGVWKRHAETNADEDVARIQIGVRDLPLGPIGEAVTNRNDITGVGQGDFELVLPALERARLTGAGKISASAVHVGDLFTADTAKGDLTLKGDQLVISPLDLTHLDGKATMTASVSLRKIKQPTVTVEAKQWIVALPQSSTELKVDADSTLALDFQAYTAAGPVKAEAAISFRGESLGQVKLDAELAQKTLQLKSIDADAFSGKLTGSATLSADAPLSSAATITWRDIDGASVAKLKPQLEGLAGMF